MITEICSKYIEKTLRFENYDSYYQYNFVLAIGYKKYYLPKSESFKKGSMILITYTSDVKFAIDQTQNVLYSDYYINNNYYYSYAIKLSDSQNWRFILNPLIESEYYEVNVPIQKKFSTSGDYNITAGFLNNNLNPAISQIIGVRDCKQFFSIFNGSCDFR